MVWNDLELINNPRNLNKSQNIKVYYENTGIISNNGKCPVCLAIPLRLHSSIRFVCIRQFRFVCIRMLKHTPGMANPLRRCVLDTPTQAGQGAAPRRRGHPDPPPVPNIYARHHRNPSRNLDKCQMVQIVYIFPLKS